MAVLPVLVTTANFRRKKSSHAAYMAVREACAAGVAAAAALLLLLEGHRKRRRHRQVMRDICECIRRRGFSIVRLRDPLERSILFDAAADFFDDEAAKRDSHIPPKQRCESDARMGYVTDAGREYLELHPRLAASTSITGLKALSAQRLAQAAESFATSCHALAIETLECLAKDCSALETFLQMEHSSGASSSFSASMLRVHRYTYDSDFPPHQDLGLVTVAPRASCPGLEVQDISTGEWISVEECMQPDEAIVFAGLTLTELSGLPALSHKVRRHGSDRLSSPYFLRGSPHVALPPHGAKGGSTICSSVGAFTEMLNEERRRAMTSAAMATFAATPTVQMTAPEGVAVGAQPQPVIGALVSPPSRSSAPARVRHIFRTLDTDRDGRLTHNDLARGLPAHFGGSLPQRALDVLDTNFHANAIRDAECSERYLDGPRFNRLFAEVLFARSDADGAGALTLEQAQDALAFLRRAPKDGTVAAALPIAVPGEYYDEGGGVRLPLCFFFSLYRGCS